MRLIFEKGKQRELLGAYKNSRQMKHWSGVARILGVSPNALKEWRYETASLPSKIYARIDRPKRYAQWIIGKKRDDWGRSLGGKNSPGRQNHIEVPKPSPLLAEFYGIILGDGNVYVNKKYGAYQIRVACHPLLEREYALFVSGLFKSLFGLKTSLLRRGRGLYVGAESRELAYFLMENMPGLKTNFRFPKWMRDNPECLRALIRGLTDTDGSIYRLSNINPDTLRISFKNADPSLSAAWRKALLRLGYHPSKLTSRNVFLTRKSDLGRYLKEIRFHNTKHRKRLSKIAPSYSGQIPL